MRLTRTGPNDVKVVTRRRASLWGKGGGGTMLLCWLSGQGKVGKGAEAYRQEAR